jgi:outer membrane protein OmpA-like peptidoglycan-associated protein
MKMKTLTRIMAVLILFSLTISAEAQIKVDLKKKLEQNVNRRLNQKAEQAINKALDSAEDSIAAGIKKDNGSAEAAEGQNSSDGQAHGKSDQKAGSQSGTSLQSYSKYDFIPGEKVIFYEDFSQDAVGDFPALWNTNGSAEVVTTNLYPGNWMKMVGDKCVWTDGLLKLPDNYTIEFDIIPIRGDEGDRMSGYYFRLYQAINAKAWDAGAVPGKAGFLFAVEYTGRPTYRTYINGTEGEGLGMTGYINEEAMHQKKDQKYHIAIWVQKARVRLYQEQNKIIDLPKAFPVASVKMDRIRLEYGAAMISNIRIAVGAPDMRNKLMTEGRLVTYGIYFDVNKDVVKPESYGTLKEIAGILNEVPDVKVKIVGHTDADGADAANLDLSKRRAASVKNELVKSFGVNGDRLVTDGMGESQPVAANDTPANKALNRRVEFIKL